MTLFFVVAIMFSALILRCHSQLTATPNTIVSQDGMGNFTTITAAIFAVPKNSVKPYYIKIKQGTYRDYVLIDKKKTNIMLIDEGANKTIITGNRSFADDYRTYNTATVVGDGFTTQDITFRNEVGPGKHQVVALRVEADFVSFYPCRFEGYQDTLYTRKYCQFYCDCEVYGTINFICGDSIAVFQNCLIEAPLPMASQYNTLIAQKREFEDGKSGIVVQNSTIKPAQDLEKMKNVTTYLGRPWGIFSRTVVMESYLDQFINPKGWIEWTSINQSIVRRPYYLEYKNRGPGAITNERVPWSSITMDPNVAVNFTVRHFIEGDKWIPAEIPHYLDFS